VIIEALEMDDRC